MEKWEDHYKQLLTENRTEFKLEGPDLKNAKDIDVNEISVNEIKKALKNSKNGKAAGPGNIFIELIKQGPDILLEILADIFNRCLIKNENIPEDWNLAYISSIFKKGDKKRSSNYRGISLTSSMGRLYGRILKERVEESFEEIEEQGGFRAGRSCTDNIFVLQQIIEKRRARNLDTHLVFIDLEKAYDTVPLKKLFENLVEANVSKTYINAIWNMYKNPKSCEEDADYMFRKLVEEYDRWGLNINLTKTEYLKVGEEQTEDPELHIHEIKRCSEYKYLGSIVSEEGNSKDIYSRVQQESLNHESTKQLYSNRCQTHVTLNPIAQFDTPNTAWNKLKENICKGAKEALRTRTVSHNRRPNIKPWFTLKVKNITREKMSTNTIQEISNSGEPKYLYRNKERD
ncbi:uncharacterized protein LOC115881259 [Sitophilus oryzae]|uniref:Uncharacterized protein LOC115881259 n=1 Tax=Sitophilus oryzae TaxID=7048 RepID=A0A6J2XU25_SITOR|nr:uncharacterized protein LOC115881259 [Sitophilus oryzae]